MRSWVRTSTGWYVTDGIQDNGFGIVTIDTKWVPTARYPEPAGNSAMELHGIRTLSVDMDTQTGEGSIPPAPDESGRVQVSIVTNHARHILSSHYDFSIE